MLGQKDGQRCANRITSGAYFIGGGGRLKNGCSNKKTTNKKNKNRTKLNKEQNTIINH